MAPVILSSWSFYNVCGKIYQEDITILNVYVPHNKTSKYMKAKLKNCKKKKFTIIVRDFNVFPFQFLVEKVGRKLERI